MHAQSIPLFIALPPMGRGHSCGSLEESGEEILRTVSGSGGDCPDLGQGIRQQPFDLVESDRLDFLQNRVPGCGAEHVLGGASRAFHDGKNV